MNTMGFTGDIGREAAALGYALLAGAAMGVYYDLFRILRRIFPFGYAMILAQDLFFWLTAAVGIFFCSIIVYEGQLRILFVMGALAGWGLYGATVGAAVMAVADTVIRAVRWLFSFFERRLLSPLRRRTLSLFTRAKGRITGVLGNMVRFFVKKKKKRSQNRQIAS